MQKKNNIKQNLTVHLGKFVTHNDQVLRKHLPVLSNKIEDLSCFLEGTRSIGKLLKKVLTKEVS